MHVEEAMVKSNKKKSHWQVTSEKSVGLVITDPDFIIIDSTPVFEKFHGQHLSKLIDWLAKFGTVSFKRL